jgi:hypothetical protein
MTSIEQVATLSTFTVVWAMLSVAHTLADHVIEQIDHQAASMRHRPRPRSPRA